MVRIAHLSDTHLGYKQYSLDEREKDIYDCMEEIGDKILEEHADIVLHSGDLFDSPRPTPQAYRAFKRFLKKIGGKTKVFAVLGDHDRPKSQGLAPQLLFDDQMQTLGVNWIAQQQCLTIDSKDVLIAGLSNVSRTYRPILLDELKKLGALNLDVKLAILLLHEGIDKFLPYENAFELELKEVPKNFGYVAMGHLHSRIKASVGKGELGYSGSSEIISRTEIDSWKKKGKGFFIVDLEDDSVEVRDVNLDCIRPQIEVRLNCAHLDEELDELCKKLEGYEKKPLVHVRVTGKNIDRQSVYQTLTNALSGAVLSFRQEFVDETQQRLPELKPGSFQVNQVIQEYFKEPKVAGLAVELWRHLRSGDVDEAKKVAEDYYWKENSA
ncbi:MAG: DNA repair exonuclease [Candidatus Bathyarchaeia archaeon]|jgi:DNA repair exonuclease SbcCD nuclease subunit